MNFKKVLGALFLAVAALAPVSAFAASDVISVGTVNATGSTVTVPVYIRDVAGTPLGMDQPSNSRIQGISFRISFSPSSAVQSISIAEAGITSGLNHSFFNPVTTSSSIALVASYTDPIPFTLGAPAPGNQIAKLTVTLAAGVAPGTSIALTVDTSSSVTLLSDSGGSAATKETVANGNLAVSNGAINIPVPTVSLSPSSRAVEQGSSTTLTVTTSSAVISNTSVTLASSDPSIAKVPASVTVPSGSSTATFSVTGVAIGSATITATLGSSNSTASISVREKTNNCATPTSPVVTAPATAGSGAQYFVSWPAASGATEYVVEESTDAAFTAPASTTTTDTTAAFTHTASSDTRYYYRVTARNHTVTCDVLSPVSSVVSVLVSPTPAAPLETRFLPVVGSTPGAAGSFFKTSVQLYNPKSATVSGKIVYHPAGASGSASDASFAYTLAPGKTLAYDDILPQFAQSGLGSADVVADLNSAFPVSLVRIFNDAGVAGTSGMTEELLEASAALGAGEEGALVAPANIAKFRLNVGVRTLGQGAAMTVTVRNADGATVKTVEKSFGPTFFTQVGSAAFLDGYALTGGESITIRVNSGNAFVYGATTDNTTNDPSFQLAARAR